MRYRDPFTLVLLAALLAGCSRSSSSSSFVAGSTTAPVTSGSPAPTTSAATPPSVVAAPDMGSVPVIVVHGYFGHPTDMGALFDRLKPGRTVVRELYVDEADALPANSLPRDAVFSFGYYRHSKTALPFDGSSSIGGCPLPRTDGLAAVYTASYAQRLRRCVESVKRATGAKQVDLVAHSMGGLVCRAYTKWLSLDARGDSSVRRLFLVASPSRGVNALEAALLQLEPRVQPFMRGGEIIEMCYEARVFSGRSFTEELNDGWDAFCAQHGIRYGGISGTGVAALGASGQTSFLAKAWNTMSTLQQIALVAGAVFASQAFPQEVQEAMSPGDGAIRVSSSRLDQAPFLGADFFATVEVQHVGGSEPEIGTMTNAFTTEAIRAYCLADGRIPHGPTAAKVDLVPVDAPGCATWIAGEVDASEAFAAVLYEEIPATSTTPLKVKAYGAPLRHGAQRLLFPVAASGGTHTFELVLYGEKGPFARTSRKTVALTSGTLASAPAAAIAVTPGAGVVHASATAPNAAPADPELRFSWRFDHGPWSAWSATSTFDTPLLGAGLHRIEVVAHHSSNAAGLSVDGTAPAAAEVLVDSAGNVTLLP